MTRFLVLCAFISSSFPLLIVFICIHMYVAHMYGTIAVFVESDRHTDGLWYFWSHALYGVLFVFLSEVFLSILLVPSLWKRLRNLPEDQTPSRLFTFAFLCFMFPSFPVCCVCLVSLIRSVGLGASSSRPAQRIQLLEVSEKSHVQTQVNGLCTVSLPVPGHTRTCICICTYIY